MACSSRQHSPPYGSFNNFRHADFFVLVHDNAPPPSTPGGARGLRFDAASEVYSIHSSRGPTLRQSNFDNEHSLSVRSTTMRHMAVPRLRSVAGTVYDDQAMEHGGRDPWDLEQGGCIRDLERGAATAGIQSEARRRSGSHSRGARQRRPRTIPKQRGGDGRI